VSGGISQLTTNSTAKKVKPTLPPGKLCWPPKWLTSEREMRLHDAFAIAPADAKKPRLGLSSTVIFCKKLTPARRHRRYI